MKLKTTPPVNLIGYQQGRLARLEVAVLLLSLGVCGLVGIGAWHVYHGLPVHYIPFGGPGISRPGVIPDQVATEYATKILQTRYTFTPASIKEAHEAIAAVLHPSLTVTFKTQAEKEAKMVKDHAMGAQLVPSTAGVIQRTAQQVIVRVEARRMIWVGGSQVREELVHATVSIVPWVAHGTPVGLALAGLTTEPALTLAGR